jgi:hypothetical protein
MSGVCSSVALGDFFHGQSQAALVSASSVSYHTGCTETGIDKMVYSVTPSLHPIFFPALDIHRQRRIEFIKNRLLYRKQQRTRHRTSKKIKAPLPNWTITASSSTHWKHEHVFPSALNQAVDAVAGRKIQANGQFWFRHEVVSMQLARPCFRTSPPREHSVIIARQDL